MELTEYSVENGLVEEPAFKWWVKDVLKKQDQIIAKVNINYRRKSHKSVIRIIKSLQEEHEIDKDKDTS